ncbi:MAG: arginine--tRNA ligase [Deltaproteobacteria bacterium]|nr:arginine--tRNA ligase [Deltaproteobacteria bacterium]
MKGEITNRIAETIAAACNKTSSDIHGLLQAPKNQDFGDIALPCFFLAKEWKLSPQDCASKLAAQISLPNGVSEVTPVAGFLNFRFATNSLADGILSKSFCPPDHLDIPENRSIRLLVEYSCPNIAKPFHVGHIRTTLLGNCLDRVLRYLNYHIESINYLGDYGTQFGYVWAGSELWGKPQNDSVMELLAIYRRATALKAEQESGEIKPENKDLPDVKQMAQNFFVDLENKEIYAVDFWKWCLKISLDWFKKSYERLDIQFDHYTGESAYSDQLKQTIELVKQKGILVESQGALGVDLGEQDGFARLTTPDGRSLYLTRDIAAAMDRKETFNFSKVLHVVAAPQALHFRHLRGILSKMGFPWANDIVHVAYGMVLGMQTRGGGTFIELNDFINEAQARALKVYHEQVTKRPISCDEDAVVRSVARAAICFFYLNRSNNGDVQFNWDQALSFTGDSGPYVLYAYARICSIKEKFLSSGGVISEPFDSSLLVEESAHRLLTLLENFESVVKKVGATYEPIALTTYALDLARAFSRTYNELHVVGVEPNLANARLALFETTRAVLGKTLELLGINPIARM